MALSESVKTSLEEAQSSLKNALAYAARQEAPYVMVEISRMIQSVDYIIKYDKAQDIIREEMNKNGFGGII